MKRTFSALLAAVLLMSCLGGYAAAATDSARASDYLALYGVSLTPGDTSGEIVIGYDVSACMLYPTLIGVSKIEIYRDNGIKVGTVFGSLLNGLLISDCITHDGDYSYKASSGKSYYAVVTVYVSDENGHDSRDVTTRVVTAP